MAKAGQSGGCLCGQVRYELSNAPLWTTLCHCESCRRAASAPVMAWMGFDPDHVVWSGERTTYSSSKGVTRSFCGTCGTPMTFEGDRWPGEIHICAVTLDDPEAYAPEGHSYFAERVAWLHLADTLPKTDEDTPQ